MGRRKIRAAATSVSQRELIAGADATQIVASTTVTNKLYYQ